MDPVSQAFVALESFKQELAAVKVKVSASEQVNALVRNLAVRLGVVERRPPDRLKVLETRLDSLEVRLRAAEQLTPEEHERETQPPPEPEVVPATEPGTLLGDVVDFFLGETAAEPPPPE